MVVALFGLPRVGKDTFADSILKYYDVDLYSFAQPFKKALSTIFQWPISSFDEDSKDDVDPFWGVSKRQMLEYIGTDIFRKDMLEKFPVYKEKIGNSIWVKSFEKFLEKHDDVIVTDLRYQIEYDFLKSIHATIIKVERPFFSADVSKAYDTAGFEFDYSIQNDVEGRIDIFENKAIELYQKISGGLR